MTYSYSSYLRRAFLALAMMAVFIRPAVAETYTVTSTSCTGPGSITEAMDLANANPGTDTITFTSGLQINAAGCPQPPVGKPYYFLQATESVIFEGNGAQLVGNIQWIDTSGNNTSLNDGCPNDKDSTKVIALTPGFMRVGLPNQDNSAISVTVRDLDMHELNSVAWIEKNASLILEDLTLNRIIAAYKNCSAGAIEAREGANFTARRTQWQTIWNFGEIPLGGDLAFNGAIRGGGGAAAGDLTLEDSYFKEIKLAGTIQWFGQANSPVNIVTSRFEEADGIYVGGAATTNIVNTLWSDQYSGTPVAANRIINTSTGPMNIIGSTLLYPSVDCNRFCEAGGSLGWIYRAPGAAKINFVQSAIGVAFPGTPPTTDTGKLLDPGGGDGFTADEYTWIQPTAQQDAAALKAVTNQPSLLTDPPGLPTGLPGLQAEWATPLNPGELIDRVPNAECGLANQLLNPIDGSCITVDALGNPRVDANGKRNIGAVQLTLAPHLTVTGTGDQSINLSWTKPRFTDPATGLTGYNLRWRVTGAGSWTTFFIPGPDSLTASVGGLTNGTEYEFEVRATYAPGGEGPYSNTVTATPYGPIGTPVVTATPGDGEVTLTWTLPDLGGRTFDSYTILWRVAGTDEKFKAQNIPDYYTNLLTISGLKNGTTYEFLVSVTASGEASEQGSATATPHGDIGTVNRSPDASLLATKQANRPRYWEREPYFFGDCAKYEVWDGFGSVWEVAEGDDLSALILKSDLTNDVWRFPEPGSYGTASAKDISHAIVCTAAN